MLRKACLEVLSTEICLAKPAQISSLLTAIMYTEKTPSNIQKLLVLMYTFMHVASASTCATLSDHILSQLQDTLRANSPSGWNHCKHGESVWTWFGRQSKGREDEEAGSGWSREITGKRA